MFDGLQDRLQSVFTRLKGEGRVSEAVLKSAVKEIRMALLEADVHFKVVRGFVKRVEEQAIGQRVVESLTPAQQVVKIVRDELERVLGEEAEELKLASGRQVILLCGLQGSGKTTTAGKLALKLRARGRHPLLAAADLQRAAAVEQLVQVGEAVGVAVVTPEKGDDPLGVARRAVARAKELGLDTVIVDTAGRLHVDEELMDEVAGLCEALAPAETLVVADAMTGQDAVRSAKAFADRLPLTGVILTKLDGDTRGGAALSVRSVAEVPVRYVGVGEKAEDLELFQPARMASRILGMGDVLTLIEKAEAGLDTEESRRMAERLARREFDLDDLARQIRQMRKLGPLSEVMKLLPRGGAFRGFDPSMVDESQLKRIEAMVNSMTPLERRRPRVLDGSRKRRVARGSGTTVQEVNQLLKQYRGMRKMMKRLKGGWLEKAFGRS